MAKKLDWVREEASGRLIYRRTYPENLRPYLPKAGQRELKVPLGVRSGMTDEAWRAYSAAKRKFDRDVQRARAARELEEKQTAGVADRLTADMIAHLVADWKAELLSIDDEVRWLPRTRERKQQARAVIKAEAEADLALALELRALGDLDAIAERSGDIAIEHAGHQGVAIDKQAPEFHAYLRALNDAEVEALRIILRRLDGEDVPTPQAPARPSPAPIKTTSRDVAALIVAYKAAKWDGWSQSSRTAVAPVFRLLTDTIADREIGSITREDARGLMDLVRQLPAGLGRKAELKDLSVPAAIEKGRQLGLSTISPGTVNLGYLAHMSALFGWAEKEEWADKNPFKGLAVHDPVEDRDKRDPFSMDQLATLFSAAPWDRPLPHNDKRPGRFWVPLIALFTGMRLGEIAGLRLMDIGDHDGVSVFNVRPYEGRSLKNSESRREVPVHSALVQLGFLSFIEARRKDAQPDALTFPDAKANVRRQWGAKLSEWFVAHLRRKGLEGTKLGFHSFRHNFEDRLRAAKLHGTPIGLRLAGRKDSGSEGNYGDGFTVRDRVEALELVTYKAIELNHLRQDDAA
ncbi:site-specific integrase [Sphingomonas phyllosphaerae]|uniref:site-specific integrase n=1 Tax=Sphingomonas phyllosphaerae TaxID=257003 RepID=UPI0018C8E0BA|nr:site-specific integrase [Sphingomonas phyllosphaerae]